MNIDSVDVHMTSSRRILMVDNDFALIDSIKEQLDLTDELALTVAYTYQSAIAIAKAEKFDIILISDSIIPFRQQDIVETLLPDKVKIPIIMLTSSQANEASEYKDRLQADDYLIKPFRLDILLERIHTFLPHHETTSESVFSIGRFSFFPISKLLIDTDTDSIVRLTAKETEILKCLYGADKKAVTRDVLLDKIWGYNASVTTHTLETHIYRLRQKIEENPSKNELLITVPDGYQLTS